ncbi:PRK06851 family protein [Paenibacillus sp. KN14-4R]|uniref:PRK06851 family protein n=1 Tax=Paenibacillus sp. KN14-4R TaxID=3445773 RepID=UPI003FA1896A
MTGFITNYYASGNTAHGFANLFDSSLQGLQRLIVVKGSYHSGKSAILRTIGDHLVHSGLNIWYMHSPSDNNGLDGLIIPDLAVGIIDGTPPRVIISDLPKEAIQYVNLDECLDTAKLSAHQSEITRLNEEIAEHYEQAYAGFARALRIHDEWEAPYIANMNFQAANELTTDYIESLFGDRKQEKESRVDHRFLGAATPQGSVDFVPNLTTGLKRHLIKGRPGSGKSTMLKKLAAAAVDHGYDVEIYHCGFDPNSLDMVIFRELGVALFDSTAPHEYFPDRDTDEILDMYEHCITAGTDEKYADTLRDIKMRYASTMKQSIQHITQAKSLQDELEQLYAQAVDGHLMDLIKINMEREITNLTAKTY